jgi:Protein of unknown function (DUF1592)/Protein of unknown function (DUF1588)/Protein of unknown function (DUF1595)/Protein of unknown function (DUF1585)/Protein of unknown function (DUF1587)
MTGRRWILSLAVCSALTGCHGGIESGAPGGPGPQVVPRGGVGSGAPGGVGPGAPGGAGPGAPGGVGGAGGSPATACQPLAPLPKRIRRLSNAQYSNAVRDLLGLPAGPVVTGGGESPHGFLVSDDEVVSPPLAFSYATAAASAAVQAASELPRLAPCPAGTSPDRCAEAFIRGFGARAFRRPLADSETAALLAVYQAGKPEGHASGLQLVIEGILQMPAFIYRTELGHPSGGDGLALAPHEVAAQLSFLLLDSLPDEELWTAATAGKLGTEAGVAAEVDRLLKLPRVRQNIDRVVIDWFGARQVLDKSKDPAKFPEFTEELKRDLLTETKLFVDDLLWSAGGKLADLVLSSRTFVNRSLARHYGLPDPGPASAGFVPATFPAGQRAGILTAGSLMAAHAQEADTSVVHRGLFMRNDVLCLDPLPPPPEDLIGSPDIQAALARLTTERARAEYRLQTGICASCHAGMDGLGLLFEHYDPLGRYRERDAGGPVDASAMLDLSPSLSGRLDGALQLAERIVSGGQLAGCASRKLLGFALGRQVDQANSCEVEEITRRFTGAGATVPELFRAVALSAALRTRTGGTP